MEKDKLKSIAIPAIGTGKLQYPCSQVSKIFFEDVTRYLTNHPSSIIDDIRFVVFGGDRATVNAFLGLLQLLFKLALECTKYQNKPSKRIYLLSNLSRSVDIYCFKTCKCLVMSSSHAY